MEILSEIHVESLNVLIFAQDKSEQTRKYSLDNLRNDVTIDEIKRPQRSSLKSAPASHHFRYKLSPNLNRDERKKSVTFTCDIKDSNVSEHRAKESIDTIEKCDTEGDCHNDNDEYIAEFMRANNLHKTSSSNENKFASNGHMYSQEGPKRLSKRKASIPTNDDVKKEGTASETEQRECCSEELKTLHRRSAEYKINNTEDCTETNGNNSEQNDYKVADENNADDEGIYNNGKPVRLARRNTVASVSSSMKKLSLGNNLTERDQQRKASAPPGIGRKRKSAVFALDPEFHAQLEKQNEERFQKEKLLERRKTEPTIVLCNSLTDSDDTPTFADLNESRKEETNMTDEERNSNSINALYSAKNKISNILYITKGKMSNRPETSSEEEKAKPLVRGIPYHSEMRMKRRGSISLHLKSIYLDDAERKIKSKRKSSTENNVFVRK